MKNATLAAMFLAAGVLAGCATTANEKLPPDNRDTDPMIVQLSNTARQAREAGQLSTAIAMYKRALERSRAMDNSVEIARNAYNLAVCLNEMEAWDEASRLLGEAERESVKAGEDLGPILLLSAETARRQGNAKEALRIIDRLESAPVSSPYRGHAYVLRARIACDQNDISRAEGFMNRARVYLKDSESPGLAAEMAEVSGQIFMAQNAWGKAATAFDREATWRQRTDRLPEMAWALEHAGQAYLRDGNIDQAADRFFRSARSLMAQGNYLDALRVLDQAVQFQEEDASSGETMAAIAELFEEVRRSLEEKSQAGVGPSEK